MGWEDRQAIALHADESRHYVLSALVVRSRPFPATAVIAISQGRFITMMPISDYQLLRPHGLDHAFNDDGIGRTPDGVLRAVFILQALPGSFLCHRSKLGLDSSVRVGIEHEDLAEMRA